MKSSQFSRAIPYLCICLALLVLFLVMARFPSIRVGDGSEYYGLYYAWSVTLRPWMTVAAYDAYGTLVASGKVIGVVSQEMLVDAFQALRVGATSDFNHFWFYSLLAFLCGKLASLLGIGLSVHASFLALHCALLSGTAAIAYHYYRWKGVVAVAMMLLVSPVFWFIDKAHTELMTVCLVLSAVILMRTQRYIAAALLIALASTQNPSFALVATIPLFYRVILQRERAYTLLEAAMLVAVVLAVLMHPVYYFTRYGVVTPQLLAGGASMGANLSTFYVWILDPDLGLLPNWPLGCAVLLVLLVARLAGRGAPRGQSIDRRWFGFVLLYLAINFYAHSSTVNLNSGATPGLARYALWYLPLAFPLFLQACGLFPYRTKRFYVGVVALAALAAVSAYVNDPRRPEQFTQGSLTSRFIQSRLPQLYDPHWEVFVERYSGIGEAVFSSNVRAVIGPDCAKMLVIPGRDRRDALAPGCMYDQAKLNAYVNALPDVPLTGSGKQPAYSRLPARDTAALARTVLTGAHEIGVNGDGGEMLLAGWSGREDWGAWSQEPRATLLFPCTVGGGPLAVTLRMRPFGKQAIVISSGGQVLWQGDIVENNQPVSFEFTPADCVNGLQQVTFDIPGAVSPLAQGLSGDGRKLGVGMMSYDIRTR